MHDLQKGMATTLARFTKGAVGTTGRGGAQRLSSEPEGGCHILFFSIAAIREANLGAGDDAAADSKRAGDVCNLRFAEALA